ncbi:DMT family transporter [Prosthecobacter sp.]|uniref:DMT family transporter n=1 Tax=Prosthecobacter sp. TaxID=1965333 RepID=UPI0037844A60
MLNHLIYALWAFAAGAVIPVMATFNAQLARSIGSAPAAVLILLLVGFFGAMAYQLSTRTPLPEAATLLSARGYLYTGGLMVVFYMISVTLLIPKFGVGNTILFVVCAQMCSSALIDHWGLFGVPVRPISWLRLIGLLVILAGLVLVQLGAAKDAR